MQIYPNGTKIKGTADLVIACLSVKSDDEIELNFCHYIGIDALNHCQITFDGNTLNKDKLGILCTSPFQLDDLQNEPEISICVKIWEKGDRNEQHFVLKDQMMKLQHQSAETIRNLQNVQYK
eukprot:116794_1